MPKFTNPSDFLIKLATDPSLVSPNLTIEKLERASKGKYEAFLKKEGVSKLNQDSLKSIKTIRSTSFRKQFRVLMRRCIVGFKRVPLVLFALFGMAIFAVFLISSIFNGVGKATMGFDMDTN